MSFTTLQELKSILSLKSTMCINGLRNSDEGSKVSVAPVQNNTTLTTAWRELVV